MYEEGMHVEKLVSSTHSGDYDRGWFPVGEVRSRSVAHANFEELYGTRPNHITLDYAFVIRKSVRIASDCDYSPLEQHSFPA